MTQTKQKAADIENLLRERNAVLEGHFLLSSGLHSNRYVQCARLFESPNDAERLGQALSRLVQERADVVVSPALGGILIGYEVARARKLPFFFTERQDGKITLRRGFAVAPRSRVLIVEDVLTTGKSTLEVAQLVCERGGRPVAAASVINRGCSETSLGLPIHSLLQLPLATYSAWECPLCKAGKSIDKPGSRPTP